MAHPEKRHGPMNTAQNAGSSPGFVNEYCSWKIYLTLTLPLSTQECKRAPANCQYDRQNCDKRMPGAADSGTIVVYYGPPDQLNDILTQMST